MVSFVRGYEVVYWIIGSGLS